MDGYKSESLLESTRYPLSSVTFTRYIAPFFKYWLAGVATETTDYMVMTITGASIGGALLLLLVCLICQRRQHQRRHRRHMLPSGSVHSYSGHQHVCDELGQRFASASVDSV